eukprot:TRINITY_DN7162_c0_g1_i1.p1 TRINITY_DN7162_c0_g1~~TRINITY_DN7162_c0_g1_i1.p1  ORF type:complete len:618 (-),score=94.83 TRINITY_DN7162_c0_g1_i1:664-2517(-)
MDCFFVSVSIRNKPELKGKPVVVSHASRSGNTGEIAAASYEARALGIKNGSWMANAKQLCPDLIVVPYDFDLYSQVSKQIYEIFVKHCDRVQALSCDEALLDVTGQDGDAIARSIRQEIFTATGCPASAGIGSSILLAQVAARRGKPNGQFHLYDADFAAHVAPLPVATLPGVGHSISSKLLSLGVKTIEQLAAFRCDVLQSEFGDVKGKMLHCFSHGLDDRPVQCESVRKSVGAEVNWGLRFSPDDKIDFFIEELSKEVSNRLHAVRMKGRTVITKVLEREKGSVTTKYLGHGPCVPHSRSVSLNIPTDESAVIARTVKRTFGDMGIAICDVRGFGIHLMKLTVTRAVVSLNQTANMRDSASLPIDVPSRPLRAPHVADTDGGTAQFPIDVDFLPRASQLDVSVLRALPAQVVRELEMAYKRKGSAIPAVLRAPSTKRPKRTAGTVSDAKPSAVFPNTQQIDVEYLAALPEDMQQEVLMQHRRDRLLTTHGNLRNEPPAQEVTAVTEGASYLSANAVFQQEPYDVIRRELRCFVLETNIVRSTDEDFLSGYFRDLMLQHLDAERVVWLLHAMQRWISMRSDDVWPQAYGRIVERVQQDAVTKYGYPMRLNAGLSTR